MHHRTIRGKILYTSRKPDRLGQERGRESFIITVHTDGKRTLRAHCEIDDPPTVLRDVVLSLDADNYPLDCFVRLTIDDRFEGSGWMRFSETHAETESFNVNDGRISQRLDLEQRTRWLASHPIAGDAMAFSIFDLSNGPGKTFFPDMMVTSPDHRGATGPLLFKLGFGIEYLGDETITVPAGTFETRHYLLHPSRPEWTPLETWVTGPDYVFVKLSWDVLEADYVLAELEL